VGQSGTIPAIPGRLATLDDVADSDTVDMAVNHGGVVLFYQSSLHAKRINLSSYESFEHIAVYFSGRSLTLLFIVIYRPGSKAVSSAFFDEFAHLLENSVTYAAASLVIVGDINVHCDVPDNPATVKFNSLLDAFGLLQHVRAPTHRGGHTLDVIINRG